MGPPEAERAPLFDLHPHLPLPRMVTVWLERALGFEGVNAIYRALPPDTTAENFFDRVLEVMRVRTSLVARSECPFPTEGPVMAVANHPFGGVDGLILGSVLNRFRPDARLIVNRMLLAIPEMAPRIIPVDVFGGSEAVGANLGGMRSCIRVLREGGCLGTFPAGEVAHWEYGKGLVESPWSPHLVELAWRSGATVVPIYFEGRNSSLFHALGMVHDRLRTLQLPRELVKKQSSSPIAVVGDPISPERLKRFRDAAEATAYLRLQTFLLRGRILQPKRRAIRRFFPTGQASGTARDTRWEPVAEAGDPLLVAREIEGLPPEAQLYREGRFEVYAARRADMPRTMESIGRLRELTFRAAHEGTGKPLDLDAFDDTYWHLFLWDRERCGVVGAYRIGLTGEILEGSGQKGFYTHTLFRMRSGFLQELHPAMELGRSFITPEYQKKHASLALIWKGIGAFITRRPEYRYLFGPVSIDKEYQSLSRDIMVQYLTEKTGEARLAAWVRPRNPLGKGGLRPEEREAVGRFAEDIQSVSALISEVEASGKGVPILLKHYIRLNARLLALNVDPAFNDSVDSLMIVDLPVVEPRLLRHYMGAEEAEAYLLRQRAAEKPGGGQAVLRKGSVR